MTEQLYLTTKEGTSIVEVDETVVVPMLYPDVTPTYEQIMQFRHVIGKYPQARGETYHDFYGPFYLRMYRMQPGDTVVGARHKLAHMFCVTKGSCKAWDTEGVHEYNAGDVVKGNANIRRVVMCTSNEPCVIITVHPNYDQLRDIAKIEELLFSREDDETAAATTAKIVQEA